MTEQNTTIKASSCEHVEPLQKATLDWLLHDVIQHHPLTSSGGLIAGAFLLFQTIQKLRGK